jgi:glucan phosphoethanolaminetransferase (alkaline phosphatase superfamily)
MLLISFYCVRLIASLLIAQTDTTANSFKELGSMFLWGMLGAAGVAVVVAFVWIKIQSRREASSDYVSINPSRHGDEG